MTIMKQINILKVEMSLDLNLKNKVVFITGSGKGIGKEIAKVFADEGANIILNDINNEVLSKCAVELSEAYPNVRIETALGNVADESDAKIIFSKISNDFGYLDILVNNAGILIDKKMIDMTLEEWKRIFTNNLDSIFLATKEAVKLMKPENKPVIINAGSFGGLIPAIGYSAYNASKAAISNLTRTMAGELNLFGIRVAGYIPGVVLTDIIRPMLEREPDRLVAQIPIGRLAEPIEIAKGVVFIASEAGSYINGTMFEITGGKLCTQNTGRN
jgi:3-oxoacyl-[acyl-carrier protein] reductase